MIVLVFLS